MFFAFHTVETETPALAEMCQGSCREEVAQRNSNQISLPAPPPPPPPPPRVVPRFHGSGICDRMLETKITLSDSDC